MGTALGVGHVSPAEAQLISPRQPQLIHAGLRVRYPPGAGSSGESTGGGPVLGGMGRSTGSVGPACDTGCGSSSALHPPPPPHELMLNPHPVLLHMELGSDFTPQVFKETMPAVAANAPSCPLVPWVTSRDCSGLLGQGLAAGCPRGPAAEEPHLPLSWRLDCLGCGDGGREGLSCLPGLSAATALLQAPPAARDHRAGAPFPSPAPLANVAETCPGWGSWRELRGSRRVRVGAAAGLAGINLIIQLIKLIPGGPAPCHLSRHQARIQAGG